MADGRQGAEARRLGADSVVWALEKKIFAVQIPEGPCVFQWRIRDALSFSTGQDAYQPFAHHSHAPSPQTPTSPQGLTASTPVYWVVLSRGSIDYSSNHNSRGCVVRHALRAGGSNSTNTYKPARHNVSSTEATMPSPTNERFEAITGLACSSSPWLSPPLLARRGSWAPA